MNLRTCKKQWPIEGYGFLIEPEDAEKVLDKEKLLSKFGMTIEDNEEELMKAIANECEVDLIYTHTGCNYGGFGLIYPPIYPWSVKHKENLTTEKILGSIREVITPYLKDGYTFFDFINACSYYTYVDTVGYE